MFSIFRGKEKAAHIIYDIGSASVACALLILEEGKLPEIKAVSRKEMAFQHELDFARFKKEMLQALRQSQETLIKNSGHIFSDFNISKIDHVIVSLSSPWFVSQTRTGEIKKKEPFEVSKELLEELAQSEEKKFKESDDVVRLMGKSQGMLIEKRHIKVLLNGYETHDPFGKKCVSMNASILFSLAPQKLIEDITREIRGTFHGERIQFIPFPSLSYYVLRDVLKTEGNFLFVDIGGEITDISLVRNRTLLTTATFPVGKKSILRKLSKTFTTTNEAAHSLLRLYQEGSSNERHKALVEKALLSAEKEWGDAFQKELTEISEHLSIPSTIFFTADPDLEKWFQALISKEQFAQFTLTDEPFKVIPVNNTLLASWCVSEKSVTPDSFLSLLAIFTHKLSHEEGGTRV